MPKTEFLDVLGYLNWNFYFGTFGNTKMSEMGKFTDEMISYKIEYCREIALTPSDMLYNVYLIHTYFNKLKG